MRNTMSAIPQAVFDADAYKETTRQQWDKSAYAGPCEMVIAVGTK